MTKEQVIAFRENAKKEGKQIFLWLDNSLTFYDNLRDCEVMIWDDTSEVVHVIGSIRVQDSVYIKAQTPYELYTFSYEEIQGMGVYLSYSALAIELDNFKKKGLITATQAEEYLVNMTDSVIEAMRLRAKAAAAMKLASEKYEQALLTATLILM